ncbi:MAG: hypothetical protein KDA45_09870 [Planctomycetales bacterium]|nr:hypothetical protein [Planctomycetales bacterium]
MSSSAWSQPQTDLASTALALAPQDAAFFSTTVNLRAAWDDFLQGNLVQRLKRVSYVRALQEELETQWQNPQGDLAQLKGTINNPNVRNLLNLLMDLASEECFVYGGDDWCDTVEGLVAFQSQMMAHWGEDPEQLLQFFEDLQRNDLEAIRLPTAVIGFRLSNTENARMQLDALEGLLRLGVGQIEEVRPLLNKLRRSDFSDGQALTLTLDTSLIPLEQLEEDQQAVAQKFMELLEGRSFSFSLGVKAGMLLIAFGEDAGLLDSVGENSSSLLDHPSLDVLKQADSRQLRSIAFVSQRWRQSSWNANYGHYFENLSAQFSGVLRSEADSMPDVEQWIADIERDTRWLDQRISDFAPEFGDWLSWSQATGSGMEGWTYDWSSGGSFENAQPMHVLQHAGTQSLVLMGWKQRANPLVESVADYLIDHLPEHIRRFIVLAEEDTEESAAALQVFNRAWILLEEGCEIVRDKIAPALASRETLLAIGNGWTTTNLGPDLPAAAEPLPLPELALVCKLDDRELFLEGCRALYELFDQAVELVRELEPGSVPPGYSVPRPLQDSAGQATSYYYAELLDALPLQGFKPQLVVTDDLLVLGYSQRQVQEMLQARSLATRPAWMTDQTPVAAVFYVDYAGMVQSARAWFQYGMALTGLPPDQPLAEDSGPFPAPSANDLLQIWDCFTALGKTAGSLTTDEPGLSVWRWAWIGQ